MRAALGDSLGARAQACHRDHDLDCHDLLAVADLADEADLIVHQALYARHRRRFVDEVWEIHLDMAGAGVQPFSHFAQHFLERLHRYFDIVVVQDLDET